MMGEDTGEPSHHRVVQNTRWEKGGTREEMIERAFNDEQKSIQQYREHIELAGKEGDPATRHLLEEILLAKK